jgi:predicted enzyme related to lactoylglutathione lyase
MPSRLALVEFPADDFERARRFWGGLLGLALEPRTATQGEGWQTSDAATVRDAASGATTAVGVHARGRGPGDSFSLPYFEVQDMDGALAQVPALGGSVVHPGKQWAICKDSEGNPFGLALAVQAGESPQERAGAENGDHQTSRA